MSDNTARRYIKRFPDFFLNTTIDGIKKFPVESVEILKRIYFLYQHEGRRKSEIEKIIRTEFPPAIDIQADDTVDTMPTPAVKQNEMMLTVMDKIDRMTQAFERFAVPLVCFLKYEGKPYKNKDVYIFGYKTLIDSRAMKGPIKTTTAEKRKTRRP